MNKGYVETGNPKYQKWIDDNVPNKCQQWCLQKADKMAEVFPELRVVGCQGVFGAHAWCVDHNSKVVDPTAHQFGGRYNYDTTHLERDDFPIGKCMYCGEIKWKDTPGVRAYLTPEEQIGTHTYCNKQLEKEWR
jgi:hypothetical protein